MMTKLIHRCRATQVRCSNTTLQLLLLHPAQLCWNRLHPAKPCRHRLPPANLACVALSTKHPWPTTLISGACRAGLIQNNDMLSKLSTLDCAYQDILHLQRRHANCELAVMLVVATAAAAGVATWLWWRRSNRDDAAGDDNDATSDE